MLRALGILRWCAMGLLDTGVINGTFLALDRSYAATHLARPVSQTDHLGDTTG